MARKAESAQTAGAGEEQLDALSFEQLLERLEGVVEALEQGDAPLEEALATFERGVMLSRLGAQRLDAAERRVEVLLRNGRTRPFQREDGEADEPPE